MDKKWQKMLPGRETEKPGERNQKSCQGPSWPSFKIDERKNVFLTARHPPRLSGEKSRTQTVVTYHDGHRFDRSPAEDTLTYSNFGIRGLVKGSHATTAKEDQSAKTSEKKSGVNPCVPGQRLGLQKTKCSYLENGFNSKTELCGSYLETTRELDDQLAKISEKRYMYLLDPPLGLTQGDLQAVSACNTGSYAKTTKEDQSAKTSEKKSEVNPCVPGQRLGLQKTKRSYLENGFNSKTELCGSYAKTTREDQIRANISKKRLGLFLSLGQKLTRDRQSDSACNTGVAIHLKKKAIPLCLPNNFKWNPQTGEIVKHADTLRSSLYVVEAAFEELLKIKDPVCVISIVGPCRDGKSFILSEAFGQPDVFSVGFKMDPETMGIWIWILPDKIKDNCGRDVRVVLLDSEGIDAAGAKGQNDNQIFSLTVLLASILIYNSKNVPKRGDLDNLNFVARLSQQIKVISHNRTRAIKNEDAFYKTFPHFIWLLRDVMTEIPDDCKDIKDYFLKRVFKGSMTSKNDPNQHIAESILKFFSGFDAFCLPAPAYNKELMKDIRRNKHLMNPDFFTGVKQFEALLKSKMSPKKSCNEGEFVTGEGLATLMKLYVKAINDPHSIPNVQTAWETFVQRKCQEAKKKALIAYDEKMKAELSKLPVDEEKVLTSHESATGRSTDIFNEETVGISLENTRMHSKELMNELFRKLSEWKTKNDGLTKTKCEEILEELREKYLDPVLNKLRREVMPTRLSGPLARLSHKEIDIAFSRIDEEYKNRAVGANSVRAEVFLEFNKRLSAEKGMFKKLADYNKSLFEQRLKYAEKDRETEKLRTDVQYMESQKQIQEKKLHLEERKRKELLDNIQEFKVNESILNKKIHDMNAAGMQNQISNLKRQLGEAQRGKDQQNREIRDLRNEHARLANELRRAQRPWWKTCF